MQRRVFRVTLISLVATRRREVELLFTVLPATGQDLAAAVLIEREHATDEHRIEALTILADMAKSVKGLSTVGEGKPIEGAGDVLAGGVKIGEVEVEVLPAYGRIRTGDSHSDEELWEKGDRDCLLEIHSRHAAALATYVAKQYGQSIGQALTTVAGAFNELLANPSSLKWEQPYKVRPALFSFVSRLASSPHAAIKDAVKVLCEHSHYAIICQPKWVNTVREIANELEVGKTHVYVSSPEHPVTVSEKGPPPNPPKPLTPRGVA